MFGSEDRGHQSRWASLLALLDGIDIQGCAARHHKVGCCAGSAGWVSQEGRGTMGDPRRAVQLHAQGDVWGLVRSLLGILDSVILSGQPAVCPGP